MANPFLAEIRIFACSFAPFGWAFCRGQILPISQNTALFSLIGTTYGGNGTSNFALPNLQGNVPIQQGQGPGLSPYVLGQMGGVKTVTLQGNQVAIHSHAFNADIETATANSPAGATYRKGHYTGPPNTGTVRAFATNQPNASLNPNAIQPNAGGVLPHDNMMPYLALNFCIALTGVFPQRS